MVVERILPNGYMSNEDEPAIDSSLA